MPAIIGARPTTKPAKRKKKKRYCAQCDQDLHVDITGKYCSENCRANAREEQKRKRAEEKEKNAHLAEEKKIKQAEAKKKAEAEESEMTQKADRQNSVIKLKNLFEGDEGAAKKLEKRLFKQNKGNVPQYKKKVRDIVSNLKNNRALLDKVLGGELTLKDLSLMPVERMAPAEIAQEREKYKEEFKETRVLKKAMVLGQIMDQPLATEHQDLGMRDPDLDAQPDLVDLNVNAGKPILSGKMIVNDENENKQEEEPMDIDLSDVHGDGNKPTDEEKQSGDAETTPTASATKMDVDEEDGLLPVFSADSEDEEMKGMEDIRADSPVPDVADSSSPPPAKKRRLNSPIELEFTVIPKKREFKDGNSTPPPMPSSPDKPEQTKPCSPSMVGEDPEPPPSFEPSPDPDKRTRKRKRTYSKMESGSSSQGHKSPSKRAFWKGTLVVSKKQPSFRIRVRRIAGRDINFPKIIPRKISVNGRVKLEAINTSLGEFARGAKRKSQKITAMFKVRRDESESKGDYGSQEDFENLIQTFATEGKGAVVDLKKDRNLKMYFLPPNLSGLDTASVLKNWKKEPPNDALWGFLIHYR